MSQNTREFFLELELLYVRAFIQVFYSLYLYQQISLSETLATSRPLALYLKRLHTKGDRIALQISLLPS